MYRAVRARRDWRSFHDRVTVVGLGATLVGSQWRHVKPGEATTSGQMAEAQEDEYEGKRSLPDRNFHTADLVEHVTGREAARARDAEMQWRVTVPLECNSWS